MVALIAMSAMGAPAISAAQGTYYFLHQFGGKSDGYQPCGAMAFDGDGNMYGVTNFGGKYDDGTVWRMTPEGYYTVLHSFGSSTNEGYYPEGGVSLDKAGNMYGTCSNGGEQDGGTVWRLTQQGGLTVLKSFSNRSLPLGKVTVDERQNLYGTTVSGGESGVGVLWKISNSGEYSVLHDFGYALTGSNGKLYPDGYYPCAGVTLDSKGNLYGTCSTGGLYQENHGGGMVWELKSTGEYKDLHDFYGLYTQPNGLTGFDGGYPTSDVALDKAGNLYGTTWQGGFNGFGNLWRIASDGTYTDLHDFGGRVTLQNGEIGGDGTNPHTGVALLANGDVYGTTTGGGYTGHGIIWKYSAEGVYTDVHDTRGTVGNVGGLTISDGEDSQSTLAQDAAGNLYGTWSTQRDIHNNLYETGFSWVLFTTPIASVAMDEASHFGGQVAFGTVTLGSAPIGGCYVQITGDPSSEVPSITLGFPGGAKTASFGLRLGAVSKDTDVHIFATLGCTKATSLLVRAPVVSDMILLPTTVEGGKTSLLRVEITSLAPAGGWVVSLRTQNSYASVPQTVRIPQGGMSTDVIAVKTVAVKEEESVKIYASAGGATVSQTLTLTVKG